MPPPEHLSDDARAIYLLVADLWEQVEVGKPLVGVFRPMLSIIQQVLVQCAAAVEQFDRMKRK